MTDNSINSVLAQMRAISEAAGRSTVERPQPQGEIDFSSVLKDSLSQVNDLQAQASAMKSGFETGTSNASLPEVMVAVQKASVSFEAVTQVRNKLLSAYQEIMNMQV